ncbi:MAG: hypothetical protein ACI9I0_001680, partial [Rhodoferax sp.]
MTPWIAELRSQRQPATGRELGAEQEVHYIAILDDIFLTFAAHLTGILGALLTLK